MSPQGANVPRETLERLDRLKALLVKWSQSLNLVSKGDLQHHLSTRHIAQSLTLIPHIPPAATRFIDLGSGGGFPALPIAIATGLFVDLVESDQRKSAFLETALATLQLRGRVWPARIEACTVPPALCVTARALAPLPRLLAYTCPKLESGGTALFLKGDDADAEIAEARMHWTMQIDITAPDENSSRILKISRLKPAHDRAQ